MSYDKYSITAYLLGNASEQDTERFDELSVADDEFADVLFAAEDDLVDAYIGGELDGADLRQFETFYLASPFRRRKVLFAEAFRQFSNGHTVEQPAAGENPQRAPDPGLFSKFWVLSVWQWGFAAAALVFACLAGWLAIQNSELRRRAGEVATVQNSAAPQRPAAETQPTAQIAEVADTPEAPAVAPDETAEVVRGTEKDRDAVDERVAAQPSPLPQRSQPSRPAGPRSVAFVLTPQLRSAGTIPEFSIPHGTEQAAFKIEMETAGYRKYTVELRDQSSGFVIWKSASTKPAAKQPNSIRVSIPARLLPAQIYTATVSGSNNAGSNEIVGDYTFRIVQ